MNAVHWQLPDRTLACGAPHTTYQPADPGTHLCCLRGKSARLMLPAHKVTCQACLQIARLTGKAA
jgi:hypothetical protein